jgi:hypothetical protein
MASLRRITFVGNALGYFSFAVYKLALVIKLLLFRDGKTLKIVNPAQVSDTTMKP